MNPDLEAPKGYFGHREGRNSLSNSDKLSPKLQLTTNMWSHTPSDGTIFGVILLSRIRADIELIVDEATSSAEDVDVAKIKAAILNEAAYMTNRDKGDPRSQSEFRENPLSQHIIKELEAKSAIGNLDCLSNVTLVPFTNKTELKAYRKEQQRAASILANRDTSQMRSQPESQPSATIASGRPTQVDASTLRALTSSNARETDAAESLVAFKTDLLAGDLLTDLSRKTHAAEALKDLTRRDAASGPMGLKGSAEGDQAQHGMDE